MKTNVYVLYGGRSVEHEVSLTTATSIINALDKKKYDVFPLFIAPDGAWNERPLLDKAVNELLLQHENSANSVVFPALHGTFGEDGSIQGLLEWLDLPYVGCGIAASALGMDKALMKQMFKESGVPQGDYIAFSYYDWQLQADRLIDQIENELGYPCFVKPAGLGSSVGISRCAERKQLQTAVQTAFSYDHKCVVEAEIRGREMQAAVIGNEAPQCSIVGEYIQERPFMDYSAKYIEGKLRIKIPATISESMHDAMRAAAIRAYKALGCEGLARVDFFVTDQDEFYVNEINTMPGFTPSSMFPLLWEHTDGTTFPQLLDRLIQLALERYHSKRKLKYRRS